jgi:peptidoglycan/LPS O-acetylase OafA/YrhL
MAPERATRIPSLDGLRAISIVAVVLGHMAGTRGFPAALTSIIRNPIVDFANLGVRVFFVISGFLITGILIDESARTGGISLKRFYYRRTLRIFPAYIVLLLVMTALDALRVVSIPTSDFVHGWTYTMNYAADRVWWVGHLWSLAVEEQFYLLWPLSLMLIGVHRAWRTALGVVCIVPLIRVAESMLFPESRALIGVSFETTADALAVGCLLALARDQLFAMRWYRAAVERWWSVPLLLLIGVAAGLRYRPSLLVGQTLLNVGIAIGIDRWVRNPERGFAKLLNARPFVYVGTLSYSIYLWQQGFLNRETTAVLSTFPVNVVALAVVALASYYLVERPVLRVRSRRAQTASPRTESTLPAR